MVQIPNTEKKLREAKFFLGYVSKAGRSPQLDREDFDFYLSAFLSAARSVDWVLRCEQKSRRKSYIAWYEKWQQNLTEDNRKLWDFMDTQRGDEVHKKGAETQGDVETVPLTLSDPDYRRDNITWMSSGWFDSPGTPPPEMELTVHYFKTEHKKVVDTCKRYLALLEKLVQEFQQAFS
jgi:hypothetical protein